jgi:hypothetical protein
VIGAALLPYKWAIIAASVIAGLGFAGWKGYALGRDRVQTKWDVSLVEIAQRQAAVEAAQRIVMQQASATYQANLAALEKRNVASRQQVRSATAVAFTCPATGQLADVVVPRALLERLRDATADPPDAAATPGGPDTPL